MISKHSPVATKVPEPLRSAYVLGTRQGEMGATQIFMQSYPPSFHELNPALSGRSNVNCTGNGFPLLNALASHGT